MDDNAVHGLRPSGPSGPSAGRGVGDVAAFYSGRGVLVTGATGLLGKVLVEKLLWAVPDIGTVFMLMRPKRGKSPAERLAAVQDLPVGHTPPLFLDWFLNRSNYFIGTLTPSVVGV